MMQWNWILICCIILFFGCTVLADEGNSTIVSSEPADDIIEEPTEEVTQEPADDVTEEPTEEVTPEPAEDVTEEPTVTPQETNSEGDSNITSSGDSGVLNQPGTDESGDDETNLTTLFESLIEETGNETLTSLPLARAVDGSNTTSQSGIDDSGSEDTNLTTLYESLNEETGNEKLVSLMLVGDTDEANTTNSSTGSDGISLTESTNLTVSTEGSLETNSTTSLLSSEQTLSSTPISTDTDSGTLQVVTLGMVTVSGTTGTAIVNQTDGTGYSYNEVNNSYTIYTSGVYYLDTDIGTDNSFAIEILASDVTIDGNSHTITGSGSETGVLIDSGTTNTTVANFAEISGFVYGIGAFGEDAYIINNSVSENELGIYSGGANSVISNNTANNNDYGIYSGGANSVISDNTANENINCGIASVGTDSVISDNIANNNTGYGIYSGGVNSVISGNTVNNNIGYGISSDGSDATISGNTANDNTDYGLLSLTTRLSRQTMSPGTVIASVSMIPQ